MANRECSEWLDDKRGEEKFGEFTDKEFYGHPERCIAFPLTEIQRIKDIILQKKGVDIIAKFRGEWIYIDEKAALAYVQKELLTYAFELLSGDNKIGWLLNHDLITTHYMLFYPKASTDDKTIIQREHFGNCEAMLIEKKKLLRTICDLTGMTESELFEKAKECRKNPSAGRVYLSSGVYLVCSPEYHECPVNVVVDKSILYMIAEWTGWIIHTPTM